MTQFPLDCFCGSECMRSEKLKMKPWSSQKSHTYYHICSLCSYIIYIMFGYDSYMTNILTYDVHIYDSWHSWHHKVQAAAPLQVQASSITAITAITCGAALNWEPMGKGIETWNRNILKLPEAMSFCDVFLIFVICFISFLFGMKSESGKCGTAQTFAPASSGKVHWVARDGCQPCGRRSSGPIESCSNVFQCVPIGSTLVVSSPCFNWLINDNMLDTCRFMMLM